MVTQVCSYSVTFYFRDSSIRDFCFTERINISSHLK